VAKEYPSRTHPKKAIVEQHFQSIHIVSHSSDQWSSNDFPTAFLEGDRGNHSLASKNGSPE